MWRLPTQKKSLAMLEKSSNDLTNCYTQKRIEQAYEIIFFYLFPEESEGGHRGA